MRALTIPQPWGWAIAHAGCDVISLPFPAPAGLLGQPCETCKGTGSVGSCAVEDLQPDQALVEAWGYGCDDCGDRGVAPLQVAIHVAKKVPKEYRAWFDAWGDPTYPPPFQPYGPDDFHPHGEYTETIDGEWVRIWWNPKYLGAVVAVATISECHIAWHRQDVPGAGTSDICCDGPWGTGHELRPDQSMTVPSVYHWRIGDVEVLDEPVPARGRTGLWEVEL